MSKRKLLICDDELVREQQLQAELENLSAVADQFDVETVDPKLFADAIECLSARRKHARDYPYKGNYGTCYAKDPVIENPERANRLFDETDLLVVDFDLINLWDTFSATGEEVAYLARCYSKCGLVVALNQFEIGSSVFDLRLDNHPETFSDLNVTEIDLLNPGLWTNEWNGFRPWYWPLLPLALDQYEARVHELDGQLNEPILRFLGLEGEMEQLPRSIAQFIAEGREPAEATFKNFVENSRNGFRPKDKPFAKDSEARVAAARVWHWLEYVLLPGQNILVDAPHLVSRYQSLLTGDRSELSDWNRVARFDEPQNLGINWEPIEQYQFAKANWLTRPAWRWSEISNDPSIREVSDPWGAPRENVVFCEDISLFCKTSSATEFATNLPTQFVRRFIKRLEDVEYVPAVQLAM